MTIYFIGGYFDSDSRSAPLLVASGLFKAIKGKSAQFKYLTYFTDGRKYTKFQKLFGRQILDSDSLRLGLFPMILHVVKNKPEVLYLVNMEFFYLPLLLLKFLVGYKIYYTSHGIAAYENHYFRKFPLKLRVQNCIIEFLIFKISDKIICLSEKTRRLISVCYKLDPGKIKILSNGIISEKAPDFKPVSFNASVLKLASIGTVTRKEKGIGFLISSLSMADYKVELNVYGENTDLLRTDIYNNLKVNSYPFVQKKQLLSNLAGNDILIVPSSYDTFNLGLLEAMNVGMLFICSDRVGLTERFDSELMKFVYKHYSTADLLDKIIMILKLSPEKKKYYSNKNYLFSLGFTWDKISSQYLELFNG